MFAETQHEMESDSDAAVKDKQQAARDGARNRHTYMSRSIAPASQRWGRRGDEGLVIHPHTVAVRPRFPASSATASAAGTRKAGPLNVTVVKVLICKVDQCRVRSTEFTRRIAHGAVPL
jgi:hypothetical protein